MYIKQRNLALLCLGLFLSVSNVFSQDSLRRREITYSSFGVQYVHFQPNYQRLAVRFAQNNQTIFNFQETNLSARNSVGFTCALLWRLKDNMRFGYDWNISFNKTRSSIFNVKYQYLLPLTRKRYEGLSLVGELNASWGMMNYVLGDVKVDAPMTYGRRTYQNESVKAYFFNNSFLAVPKIGLELPITPKTALYAHVGYIVPVYQYQVLYLGRFSVFSPKRAKEKLDNANLTIENEHGKTTETPYGWNKLQFEIGIRLGNLSKRSKK